MASPLVWISSPTYRITSSDTSSSVGPFQGEVSYQKRVTSVVVIAAVRAHSSGLRVTPKLPKISSSACCQKCMESMITPSISKITDSISCQIICMCLFVYSVHDLRVKKVIQAAFAAADVHAL
ncbi:hypothetical protein D3C87_1849420 [compost metagenome]